MNEVLSAKSWMYFSKSPSKIVKKAYLVVLKGHQMGEVQRPNSIRRLMSLLSDQGPPDQLQDKALQT